MSGNINGRSNGKEISAKEGRQVSGFFRGKTLGSRQYRRKLERLARREERSQIGGSNGTR